MKKTYIIMLFMVLVFTVSCGKKSVKYIVSIDNYNQKTIEEVLENKDLNTEEKAQIIQMKMAEQLERKKRAVETEKDNKLAAIINRPVTPLRTPDTILRVLLLPYTDSNNVLHSWKYSFVKVDDGKWILSDYLNSTIENSGHFLTPLEK